MELLSEVKICTEKLFNLKQILLISKLKMVMYLTLFIQEDTGKDSFIRKALMMLKKVVKIIDFLLSAVIAILGSTLLMMVVLLLVKLFMGDVHGL